MKTAYQGNGGTI